MKRLMSCHTGHGRLLEPITKIASIFLEVEDPTNLTGPLERIMHLIASTNIHLVPIIHAAKDHIKKTESVYYVLEVPIKYIQVINHAQNDLLEQQILN